MCQLKSGIITKDGVFLPEYDSHTEMLVEMGIEDTRENAARLFVRAELSPKNGDAFTPIDDWVFMVDQDIIPEWFVKDYEKTRMVSAVKEWAKTHIHDGINNLNINSGTNHYIRNCKNVNISGSATVKNISGSATVGNICGSATVGNIYGSATVISSPHGWSKKETMIISDNATFIDRKEKVIYQAGSWKFVSVNERSNNDEQR